MDSVAKRNSFAYNFPRHTVVTLHHPVVNAIVPRSAATIVTIQRTMIAIRCIAVTIAEVAA